MPLFSLDNGRLRPASSQLAQDPEIAAQALMALRDQVTELLHQPFFPVSWLTETPRMGRTERQTSLVALEPSGQTVTIDVVEHLDSTTLMSCLARAGRHADMNRGRLASLYPRGTAAFRRDWQEFLDSCPTMTKPGPRLIVLALSIDPEMRGALDSLLGTGVQLFRIALHDSRSGLLVSLDEVRPHEASFQMIAQAARREEISATPSATTAEEYDDWDTPGQADAGEHIVSQLATHQNDPEREGSSDPQGEPEAEGGEAASAETPESSTDLPLDDQQGTERDRDESDAGGDEPSFDDGLGDELDDEQLAGDRLDLDDEEEDPIAVYREDYEIRQRERYSAEKDLATEKADFEALSAMEPADFGSPDDLDFPRPSSELADLVSRHGEFDVTFRSLRRRVNATGRVTAAGLVVNGETYTDPDEAASALAGRSADGWRVWRLKDGRRLSDLR